MRGKSFPLRRDDQILAITSVPSTSKMTSFTALWTRPVAAVA
jgi:hypothetical protein